MPVGSPRGGGLGEPRGRQQGGDPLGRGGGRLELQRAVLQGGVRCGQADAEERERQHVDRLDPAAGHEPHGAGQDHQEHGGGRDHELADRGGLEHRPDPGAEELGVGVDLGQQALVGPAGLPERLDDLDALDELDRGGADPAHADVPLGDLLAHAAHHGAVGEEEQRDRDEGDQRQPPVHPEQVGQRGQRGDERGGQLDRGVCDQMVHGGHVVLDGLPDLAGAPVGEPAEGDGAEVAGHPAADVELQVVVGEVGDGQGAAREQDPRPQRADGDPHDRPHPSGVRRPAGQQLAGDLGDGDERDQPGDRGRRLHEEGEREPAADRSEQLGEGLAVGRGRADGRRLGGVPWPRHGDLAGVGDARPRPDGGLAVSSTGHVDLRNDAWRLTPHPNTVLILILIIVTLLRERQSPARRRR